MNKKVVRYKGKRHFQYFTDEGPKHLVPIDKDGKEVANVKIEEYEASDIQDVKMFDEDYVQTLREESKKSREALEGLQKQFEGMDPVQLQEMAAKLKETEEAKEAARQESLKKEGKWQEILDANEIYGGCYCKVNMNVYTFEQPLNKGVTIGLNGIQKWADGEALGGGRPPLDEMFDVAASGSDNPANYGDPFSGADDD